MSDERITDDVLEAELAALGCEVIEDVDNDGEPRYLVRNIEGGGTTWLDANDLSDALFEAVNLMRGDDNERTIRKLKEQAQ